MKMNGNELRLCKDCAHCVPYMKEERSFFRTKKVANYELSMCGRKSKVDLVDGKIINERYCSTERMGMGGMFGGENYCGLEGLFFQPIEDEVEGEDWE